jgi:pSer/pThr/pTyr-binding forkhead associated (FHA) protein
MKDTSVALTTGREGEVIPVAGPTFLIGRDRKCQLRLGSIRISRCHCALLVCDGKVFVWDLNSANGTFVNDRRVQAVVELLHGDCLRVGPLEFKIQIDTKPLTQTMDVEALRLSLEKDNPVPSV